MSDPKIKIVEIARHRNGVCGAPFWAVLFDDAEHGRMVATVFDTGNDTAKDNGYCAVYSVAELAAGNIAFAMGNSWRGDHYEHLLRRAILASSEAA